MIEIRNEMKQPCKLCITFALCKQSRFEATTSVLHLVDKCSILHDYITYISKGNETTMKHYDLDRIEKTRKVLGWKKSKLKMMNLAHKGTPI